MSLRSTRILLAVLLALEAALLLFGPQLRDHQPAIEAALAAKEKPDWWDDAAVGIHYAAWINAGLLLVLLLTAKWWAGSLSAFRLPPSAFETPRWFWPLALLAVLTCLALRLPLAGKSLWWDESWVVMQVTHGKWRPDTKKPGEFRFLEHDWKRAAFYYQKPTNHVPMSLAQKASFTVWQKLTRPAKGEFSNLAARAPALLASCAAVLLMAMLLRSWGWPGASVIAAFLLALHPWHIRYGVDARAYALVVPLCLAGMFAVSRIWQSRGAAILPWICWGVVEFLWLWAYPNAVLDVALLNVLLALIFLRDREARAVGLMRLLITNVFAAMAFVQVFLPNVMQALHWAGSENVAQPLNLPLIKSTLSQLFLGVEFMWADAVETKGLVSSGAGMAGTSFAGAMLLLTLSAVLLVISRRGSTEKLAARHWILLGTPVLSSLLFTALVGITGSYFYPRFIIAALPCVIALIALLFAEAISDAQPAAQKGRWARHALAWGLAVFLAAKIMPFWFAQTGVLTTRPYAPLRDVAEFVVAAEGSQEGPKPLTVCYGHGHEVMPVYLPQVQAALSKAELEEFINGARGEHRPLLVLQGHSVHNRALIPDGFTLLDDRNLFEEVKSFAGIEPEFYWRVFRLR